VNFPVWITSIGINSGVAETQPTRQKTNRFGQMQHGLQNNVTFEVKLIEVGSRRVVASAEQEFTINDLVFTNELKFPQPAKLLAKSWHLIKLSIIQVRKV